MAQERRVERIAKLSRRAFLATAAASGLGRSAFAQSRVAHATIVQTDFLTLPAYGNGTLPAGIRSPSDCYE